MERLRRLSQVEEGTGCWVWVGTHDKGVPILRLSNPRRLTSARRYGYETFHGIELPRASHVVDTCGNRSCVNPAHLVLGGSMEGSCLHGHPRTDENTYRSPTTGKPQCRVCHRVWQRKDARRPEVRERQRTSRDEWRAIQYAFVNAWKAFHGCARCGEKNVERLHFHHRDPESKEVGISAAVAGWTRERLLEEMGKCDVLCAGCHSKRHVELRKLHAGDRVNGELGEPSGGRVSLASPEGAL